MILTYDIITTTYNLYKLTISWPSPGRCPVAESRANHRPVASNATRNDRRSSNRAGDNSTAVDGSGETCRSNYWSGEDWWAISRSGEGRRPQDRAGQRRTMAQVTGWCCGHHWQSRHEENRVQGAHDEEEESPAVAGTLSGKFASLTEVDVLPPAGVRRAFIGTLSPRSGSETQLLPPTPRAGHRTRQTFSTGWACGDVLPTYRH